MISCFLYFKEGNLFSDPVKLTTARILFSSFPHGYCYWLGLFLSCGVALVATTYAVLSCRFILLTYSSTSGNFEDYFNPRVSVDTASVTYQTALGLFGWTAPENWMDYWSGTNCVGYPVTIMEEITDEILEIARAGGVLSVLLAFVIVFLTLLTSCFKYNWLQTVITNFCAVAGIVFSGLTFLIKKSAICTTTFENSECTFDEGGIVMFAAISFWFISLLIACSMFKPAKPVSTQVKQGRRSRVRHSTSNTNHVNNKPKEIKSKVRVFAEDSEEQIEVSRPAILTEKY